MTSAKPNVEGTVPFEYKGETYQTYYKVFGDLSTATRTPLLVAHGGPGFSHDYLLPHADLAEAGIPVIFYDQIGNARSTHLRDKPTAFWTIDLFIDELQSLLAALKIDGSFDLLGHSWGGCLAAEFEVRRAPKGLRKLVLADSLASVALWSESTKLLLKAFPKEVAEGMGAEKTDVKAFVAARQVFFSKHIIMVTPWPKEVLYSLDRGIAEDGDPTVSSAPYVIIHIYHSIIVQLTEV